MSDQGNLRKTIKIRYQNGINRQIAEGNILNELIPEYDFIESDNPDFVLFGPYGNDIPAPGNYIRIGYYCENFKPNMSICDWAFGIPHEDQVKHPRYKRIQWHGLDPQKLVKPSNPDVEEILAGKKHFCNFLYSNRVPHREEFFRQLSKYKKVDAPGRSMNNMPGIDNLYKGDMWERKKQFLSEYKFTIAFESYVYPGYQTEKLYDAMQVNSLPIYCGDPLVGKIFNTKSFINAPDFISTSNSTLVNWLEKKSHPDFFDMQPHCYIKASHRIKRKLKAIGRRLKMQYQFQKLNFKPLIDRIVELDEDERKYTNVLQQPWFVNNLPPMNVSLNSRWIEIFNSHNHIS